MFTYILIFMLLVAKWKSKDSESSDSKYSNTLMCSYFLRTCNFDLLVSFPNI